MYVCIYIYTVYIYIYIYIYTLICARDSRAFNRGNACPSLQDYDHFQCESSELTAELPNQSGRNQQEIT